MKVTKRLTWSSPSAIKQLANCLKNNEVIAGDSDTVPGLLAPLTQEGKDKLDFIKKRTDKPYLVLVETMSKARTFTEALENESLAKLAQFCWPGPLTLLVKARSSVPYYVASQDGVIALRIPHHQGLLTLLNYFSGLFSTSANISGMPIAETVDAIDPEILNQVVALIVNDPAALSKNLLPSTILDCTKDTVSIARHGAYAIEALERVYGKKLVDG